MIVKTIPPAKGWQYFKTDNVNGDNRYSIHDK